VSVVLLCATCGVEALAAAPKPIALHPENPHYLLFRGKPAVLVTSTEHYGAVLNLDFDYVPYLDELQRCGLNLTRTFSGVYCEDARSFNIKGNPLAPRRDKLICPFARSGVPGYANGGNKFDLSKWDEAYFRRLKDFVAQAGKRGIVVELVLFCPFYEDTMWNLSPMKADNNISDVGTMPRTEVYTLRHPKMLAVHQSVTRKIVEELRDFDNVYYEICNEPYFGGVTLEWQAKIAEAVTEAEKGFPHKHLVAQNIANGKQKIENPNPAVSIFNFHYATPPDTVAMNFGLNKVLADDETGFKGKEGFVYRAEGWDFLMAGGAIYDNLDYSFTPDRADGTAVPDAPGGGGHTLRMQLKALKDFIERFDFVKMAPDNAAVRGSLPPKVTARALVEKDKQYAIYIRGDGATAIKLDLPAGKYTVEMVHPKLDKPATSETRQHPGGELSLPLPAYSEDLGVGVRRMND
jgi:hypothetical protein